MKCIGKGGTSKVFLVRHLFSGNLFALKRIPKVFLADQRKCKQLMIEREVFARVKDGFLAKLVAAFESVRHLNFLMEYYPGGELFFHLKRRKLAERASKFYLAQVILALEALHTQHIIYRDLKVLILNQGKFS